MKAPNNYDHYYLDPNRTKDPKESFKFIAEQIMPYLKTLTKPAIADIGCATGDLMYYIKSLLPDASYMGLDVDNALLEKASKELPFADFKQIDITNKSTLPDKKFDLVLMNGVHGYYETMDVWVANFSSLVKKGGRGYLFSTFNSEDVDVIIRLRNPKKTKEYMTFGCLFSFETVKEEFQKVNMSVNFIPFQIGIDVPKNNEDPIRSWTFNDENGNRITKNGAQIIQNYYLVEIKESGN